MGWGGAENRVRKVQNDVEVMVPGPLTYRLVRNGKAVSMPEASTHACNLDTTTPSGVSDQHGTMMRQCRVMAVLWRCCGGAVAVAVAVAVLWLWLWLCCGCDVATLWLCRVCALSVLCMCAVSLLWPTRYGTHCRDGAGESESLRQWLGLWWLLWVVAMGGCCGGSESLRQELQHDAEVFARGGR